MNTASSHARPQSPPPESGRGAKCAQLRQKVASIPVWHSLAYSTSHDDGVLPYGATAKNFSQCSQPCQCETMAVHVWSDGSTRRSPREVDSLASTFSVGWRRLELSVPARLRLWRWQARRALMDWEFQRMQQNQALLLHDDRGEGTSARTRPCLAAEQVVSCPSAGRDSSVRYKIAPPPIPSMQAGGVARGAARTRGTARTDGTARIDRTARIRRTMIFRAMQNSQLLRRYFPLLVVFFASVACSLVSHDKETKPDEQLELKALSPELSKPKGVASRPVKKKRNAPWAYVLPLDHGVRADQSGQGHFRAPRFHGEHNGIDLLAPIGTSVFSPCEGQVMAGVSRSFGRWLHVICPVPDEYMKAGGPRPWASFFFAHLQKTKFPNHQWGPVKRGQTLGAVGKSGNAGSKSVQPHVHLELIVQKNRRHAMDEHHLGRDQSNVFAAEYFADALLAECMAPYGFQAKSRHLRRARRIDPFVALTCLSQQKPDYKKAPSPLTSSSHAWTKFYVAEDFNVNLGVEDMRYGSR